MGATMDDLWQEIDRVDSQICELFEKRMALVLEVAKLKEQNNLPVLNAARERDVLARVTAGHDDETAEYLKVLFTTLFDISRSCQSKRFIRNQGA